MKRLLSAAISAALLVAGDYNLPAQYIPPLGTGQPETWTGAANDGRWNNGLNWSGKAVPGTQTGAIVPGGVTIYVEGTATASWIETAGSGTALLSGSGTLQTAGLATTNGAGLEIGCALAPVGLLHSVGDFTIVGGGSLTLVNGPWPNSGNVTIQSNGTLSLQGSKTVPTMPVKGNLINLGTINVSNCALAVSSNFTQSGSLSVNNGYTTCATLTTGGAIQLQNSEVLSSGAWTVSGPTTINFPNASNRMSAANSAAQTWTGTVSIGGWANFPDNRIQIGSNGGGLSVAQLNDITFQNVDGQERNAYLSAYGYLTPNMAPIEPAFTFTSEPPQEVNVEFNGTIDLTVATSRPTDTKYQWQLNGTNIPRADVATYVKRGANGAAGGLYACVCSSENLAMTSQPADVVVGPKLLTELRSCRLAGGASLSLKTSAEGTPPLSYQWLLNGQPIPGAGGINYSNYSVAALMPSNAGLYSVSISNRAGMVTSPAAAIEVLPQISQAPTNGYGNIGDTVSLSATAIAPSGAGALESRWYYCGWSFAAASNQMTDNGVTKTLTSYFNFKVEKTTTDVGVYFHNEQGGIGAGTAVSPGTRFPLVISLSPASGTTITNPASVTISSTVTDPNLGGTVTNVSYYEGATLLGSGSSATLASPTAGSYTIQATASDSYGNTTSATTRFTVAIIPTGDLVAPIVSVSAPANGPVGSAAGITVNAANNGPGTIQSVQLLVNGAVAGTSSAGTSGHYSFSWTPPASGSYTLSATATTPNNATGSAAGVPFFAYVPAAPLVALTPASETLTNAASITLNASATAESTAATITNIQIFDGSTSLGSSLPVTVSSPTGTHNYKAVAADSYGVQGTSATSTIVFLSIPIGDLTAPAVFLSAPSAGLVNAPTTITVTAAPTNNEPGSIQSVQLLINGASVATNTQGTNNQYVFSWTPTNTNDYLIGAEALTAQNVPGTSTTTDFQAVQPVAPIVSISPASETLTNATNITLSAAASAETDHATITNLSIYDGITNLGTNLPITISCPSNGTQTYKAVALDSYGVQGSATTTIQFVSVPLGDMSPPTVTLSAPSQSTEFLPVSITVTASNNGPGTIASAQLLVNGSVVATSTSGNNGLFTFSWTPPTTGGYTLKATAFTAIGNFEGSSSAESFTATSYAAPAVTLSQPSGTVNAGQVQLEAGATDPENQTLSGLTIYIDGTVVASGSGSINTWLATNSLAAGTHTAWASATDPFETGYSPTNTFTLQGSQSQVIWSAYGQNSDINGTQAPLAGGSLYGVVASAQSLTANNTPQEFQYQLYQYENEIYVSTTLSSSGEMAGFVFSDFANDATGLSLAWANLNVPGWSSGGYIAADTDTLVMEISSGNEIRIKVQEQDHSIRWSSPWGLLAAGQTLYPGAESIDYDTELTGGIVISNLPFTNLGPSTPSLALCGGTHTGKTTDTYLFSETVQVSYSNVFSQDIGDSIDHIDFHQVLNGDDTIVLTVSSPATNGTVTLASPPLPLQTVSFYAIATDRAGDASPKSQSVSVIVTDPPPVISITLPASGSQLYEYDAQAISISSSDQSSLSLNVYANGTLIQSSASANGTDAFSWTPSSIGTTTLSAVATDPYGVSATNTVSVTVISNPPPAITLSDANNTVISPGNTTFWASATEQDGKAFTISLYLNNSLVGQNSGPTVSFTTNYASGTTITLNAVVVDALYTTRSTTNTINILATAQTELLLHMNGANNGTSFPDSSAYDNSVSAAGSAVTSTTESEAGGASLSVNGATTSYLELSASNVLWNLNDSAGILEPLTLEAWIYLAGTGRENVVAANGDFTSGTTSWAVYVDSNNLPNMSIYDNTAEVTRLATGTTALSANTWYNIAGAFDGSEAHIWINGVMQGSSGTLSGIVPYNQPLTIGAGWAGGALAGFDGYIDELRLTTGAPIYNGPYVPLTQPGANLPPIPVMIAPSAATNMQQESSYTLMATATCPGYGDYVTNVSFYDGTTNIAKVTNATGGYYSYTWTPGLGTHTISAIAYNEEGSALQSGSQTLTASDYPPTVALAVPSGTTNMQNGNSITLSATASCTEPGDVVSYVDFLDGTTLLAQVTTPVGGYYTYTWTPALGTHAVSATAYNQYSNWQQSAIRIVTVSNYITWTAGSGVTIGNNGRQVIFNNAAGGAYAYAPISQLPSGKGAYMTLPSCTGTIYYTVCSTKTATSGMGYEVEYPSMLTSDVDGANGHYVGEPGVGYQMGISFNGSSYGETYGGYWSYGTSAQYILLESGGGVTGTFSDFVVK